MITPEQLYEELILNVEVDECGNKCWYNSRNQSHRMYGPAIEYVNGTRIWYQNGLLHREDGPAIEWFHGTKEYWIEGIRIR